MSYNNLRKRTSMTSIDWNSKHEAIRATSGRMHRGKGFELLPSFTPQSIIGVPKHQMKSAPLPIRDLPIVLAALRLAWLACGQQSRTCRHATWGFSWDPAQVCSGRSSLTRSSFALRSRRIRCRHYPLLPLPLLLLLLLLLPLLLPVVTRKLIPSAHLLAVVAWLFLRVSSTPTLHVLL